MNSGIDPELRGHLGQMTAQEKRAFLRVVLRLRAHCPRCVVTEPRLEREPCRACVMLPGEHARPMSALN